MTRTQFLLAGLLLVTLLPPLTLRRAARTPHARAARETLLISLMVTFACVWTLLDALLYPA